MMVYSQLKVIRLIARTFRTEMRRNLFNERVKNLRISLPRVEAQLFKKAIIRFSNMKVIEWYGVSA